MQKYFLIISVSLFFSSCVTTLPVPAGVPEISTSDYEDLVAKKTKKVEIYSGLYNQLTVAATRLDSQMSEGSLAHTARQAQWQESKFREEKTKVIAKHSSESEFFVSFYTPERKHSDLASSKGLWKLFLDVNGQRYEGKATRVKTLLSEVQALYPLHNRWSVPFIISFPVSTSTTENKAVVLTITGSLSSAQVKFD